ncbi:hypothetical protein AWC35_04250 [Gibbsiella quercinecans]|uniref:Uncharacterized protein n=1 Tax=Gibbsiella quercinecans TaxID=929813 RepID=A0A250AXF5_9GAMM|nr:hypothetical protein AWC35_04250 [Gibbsiella quercinecans]RLM14867.1 hypothetical protein BIY30_00010 [Gibbsiella quercinecans]
MDNYHYSRLTQYHFLFLPMMLLHYQTRYLGVVHPDTHLLKLSLYLDLAIQMRMNDVFLHNLELPLQIALLK